MLGTVATWPRWSSPAVHPFILWVLDSSVLLAPEVFDDQHHRDAARLLQGTDPLATIDLAFSQVTNVAVRAWQDGPAARRLHERIVALPGDRGLLRADAALRSAATAVAEAHGISLDDAAYVAAAAGTGAELVSCDLRALVSRGLARLPADAGARSA